jgi:hypothetical protein
LKMAKTGCRFGSERAEGNGGIAPEAEVLPHANHAPRRKVYSAASAAPAIVPNASQINPTDNLPLTYSPMISRFLDMRMIRKMSGTAATPSSFKTGSFETCAMNSPTMNGLPSARGRASAPFRAPRLRCLQSKKRRAVSNAHAASDVALARRPNKRGTACGLPSFFGRRAGHHGRFGPSEIQPSRL